MKVSVLTITYNHEKYVAQAIASALGQRTDFPYEIIVSEDCSTDGTRAVVGPLAARHPDKVRLLLNDRNLGPHRNFLQAYAACRGEYVAILDGDDYWTAPHKLQRQVDFLDAHPECAFCFHDALMIGEGDGSGGAGERTEGDEASASLSPRLPGSPAPLLCRPPVQKPLFDLVDLLPGNFIYGATVLFRNRLIDRPPDWIFDLMIGDWPFYILLARHGRIGYLDEAMAVYRKLGTGMMNRMSLDDVRRTHRALYGHLERSLDPGHGALIRGCARMWDEHFRMREEYLRLRGHANNLEEELRDSARYARDLEGYACGLERHARDLEEAVRDRERHAANLGEQLRAAQGHARGLEEQVRSLEEHARTLGQHARELEEHALRLGEVARDAEGHGRNLEAHARNLDEYAHDLERQTRALEGRLRAAEDHTGDLEGQLRGLEDRAGDLQGQVRAAREHAGNLEEELRARERHAGNLEQQVRDLQGHVGSLEEHTRNLEEEVRDRERNAGNLEEQLRAAGEYAADLEERNRALAEHVARLEEYAWGLEEQLREREESADRQAAAAPLADGK